MKPSCYRLIHDYVQAHPGATTKKIADAVRTSQRLLDMPTTEPEVVRASLAALRRDGFVRSKRTVAKGVTGRMVSMQTWTLTTKPVAFTKTGRLTLQARGTVRNYESRRKPNPVPVMEKPIETAAPAKPTTTEALLSVPMLGERVTFTITQARDLHRNLNAIFN